MKKIPSLFKRNYEGDRLVYDEVVEGSEWVINGEGVATVKWDGTSVMIKDGTMHKRYDAKNGKTPPVGFIAAQEPDEKTGHWPGWIPCVAENPADKWHFDAVQLKAYIPDGTYELVGPKVQGNPYGLSVHDLFLHGDDLIHGCPRDFEGIKAYLKKHDHLEGVVWHHEDGRMVKIKRKDFFKK